MIVKSQIICNLVAEVVTEKSNPLITEPIAKRSKSNNRSIENNRDKIRTLISDWTKRNPEKNRQTSLAFYHRNKHKKNNNELSWAKQNPEANREKTARREAQKRANQSFVILSKDLKKLYDSVCTYCGISGEIQADHVVPISRGGVHGISNLVPACRTCNQSKGSKLLSEWRLWKKENPR